METEDLALMLEIARLDGFAPAARARGVDPSSVSRRVAEVEARLGIRLFERTTRRLSLTEAGAAYLARAEEALELLEAAGDAARSATARPRGLLRLTASVAFVERRLSPLIPEFLAAHPEITLELRATDAVVDLVGEGVDLAIRLAPEAPRGLAAVRLRPTRYRVVASPAYLAAAPALERPEDLSSQACVRFALPDYRTRWRFRRGDGPISEVQVSGRLVISTALGVRDAALAGLGPALLADWLIDGDLAAGRLVDLFPAFEATATGFGAAAWIVYPSARRTPAKTRAAIDFLTRRLGDRDGSANGDRDALR